MRKIAALVGLIGVLMIPLSASAVPTRTVIHPTGFQTDPGQGCSFGVLAVPDVGAFQAFTQFDDGRLQTIGNALGTYTNLDTGKTVTQRSNYRSLQVYDPTSNTVSFTASGQFTFNAWEGDQGPYGEVGEDGALFSIAGTSSLAIDLDTFVITSFSYQGLITDLCSLLEG